MKDSAKHSSGSAALPDTDRYDVFISYSRKNSEFASKLEARLRAYRSPTGLGLPKRHLRVFRDQSDLAGDEYTGAISKALAASDKLIVLCSPEARASTYVDHEIERFVESGEEKKIISILLAGTPNNEVETGQEADAAFPRALCRELEMPLAIDYRGIDSQKDRFDRGVYYPAWYTLLAQIYGVSRAAIEQRDRQRRRRRQLTAVALLSLVMTALGSLTVWALTEKAEAEWQRDIAVARLLANAAASMQPRDLERRKHKALLAIEALGRFARRGEPSMEADRALRDALRIFARRTNKLEFDRETPVEVRFSRDGDQLTVLDSRGNIHRFSFPIDGNSEVWRPKVEGRFRPVLSADGTHVAVIDLTPTPRHTVSVFAVGQTDGEPIGRYSTKDFVELSADGRLLVVDSETEYESLVLDVVSGTEIARFPHASRVVLSPDGQYIAIKHRSKRLERLELLRVVREGSNLSIESLWQEKAKKVLLRKMPLVFSTDSRFVLIRDDRSLSVVETESGVEVGAVDDPKSTGPLHFALGPGGRYLVVGGTARGDEVHDLRSGDSILISGGGEALSLSPDGRFLTGRDVRNRKALLIWEILSLAETFEAMHTNPVLKLRMVSDPPTLITITKAEGKGGGWMSEARALAQGFPKTRPDLELGAGDGWIGEDGTRIAFQSEATVQFWDAREGRLLHSLPIDDTLANVVFEKGGPHVALDDGQRVRVVDLDTRTLRADMGYTGKSTEIRLASDGWSLFTEKRVVVHKGARNEGIVVEPTQWDLRTGVSTTHFLHKKENRSSQRRPFEWSRAQDGTIHITRSADLREIARLDPETEVALLNLSEDGNYLVGRISERVVRIWFLAPGKVIERACEMVGGGGIGQEAWNRLIPREPYQDGCLR